MYKKFLLFPTIILSLTIYSCSDIKVNETVFKKKYVIPNIDSLINSQVKNLSGKKISKRVILNGKEELSTIETDSVFWKTELSVFSNLEINKSSLVGAYEENIDDDRIIFRRKKNEKKGAVEVALITSTEGAILNISGLVTDVNALYASNQRLSMTFDKKTKLLSAYSFSGFQKLIAMDSIRFEIVGKIE